MSAGVVFSIMGVIIAVAVGQIVFSMLPQRERAAKITKIFQKVYRVISRNFITQGYVGTLYGKVSNLSIYKREEVQSSVVKYFLISWGAGGAIILAGMFLYSDFLTTLICIMFAVLLTNIIVDKQLDKTQLNVWKAMVQALSSIRQEYMRTANIVEALSEANIPPLIKRPIDEIIAMLTSVNSELKLQEFCESTPFRTMQTLAAICFHINNQGDEKDVYGQSNFTQAMTLLISDVNNDIQKVAYRKSTFGIIEYLPFIPIFTIGLMEGYFISIMPGTAIVYNGVLGYILRTTTVLLSVICYVIVSRINCNVPIKEDDRGDFVVGMLSNPVVRRMIYNITPKNTGRVKLEFSLKQALSRMSPEQFYAKKVISGFAAFLVAVVTLYSSVELGKEFLNNSTQSLSLVATAEMDDYKRDQILAMDAKYLADPTGYTDKQKVDLVTSNMPGLSDLQIQDQVKRMETKAKQMQNAYFKWWFILVATVIGVLGWFSPELMLKVRKVLIQTEEEDDFLELQTLVSILMNTNIDTMDLLRELAQHSRIHKEMFLYAYQGYASNPELELTRLQAKTPLVEFKQFIGKMKLTISDLSIREAYSDLLIEREHILRIREMAVKDSIGMKRFYCGPLSMIPLGAMIISSFLVPIGILGYNEFMGALSNMG